MQSLHAMRIGDYEIDCEVRAGVYEATHVVLPRRALIRVADRPEAMGLLRRACMLEALHHTAVPRMYECGVVDGCAWTASELVEGEPMAAAEPIAVLREVAGVLAHAHARGIIHRALRPDAIVIADGVVRVIAWDDALLSDHALARAMDIIALGRILHPLLDHPVVDRMLAGHVTAAEVVEQLAPIHEEELILIEPTADSPPPPPAVVGKLRWTPPLGVAAAPNAPADPENPGPRSRRPRS